MGTVLVETAEALGVRPGVLSPRRCLEVHTWSIIAGTAPFPEVPEVLASLQEKGIKLGIVTNAYQPMWMRDIEIEGHGLLPFFPECRLSAADVGYLKPHPVIFQTALECLGTRPEETVFVGDNPLADVMGAKRAGLRAVLRRTNTVENAIGEAIEPDHVVNDLLELIDILAKWYPDWDR
jgi:HAD superfamily hydrolase (TIGR01662 family)